MLPSPRRPRRRARRFVVVLLGAALTTALGLSACSGSAATAGGTGASAASAAVADTSPEHLQPCPDAGCTGTLEGARYQVLTPQRWNGTLLIYSHGYRFAQPVPPDYAPIESRPAPAPGADVATRLLAQGYALAGSAFATNGWDVQDGVRADQHLYDWFAAHVGRPRRVYAWGDSLGGLITQTLAERRPAWLSGAAPLCGVLGGTNENLDLALDVAFAVRTLLAPTLRLTGYRSPADAAAQWTYAQQRLVAATKDLAHGVPRIALVAALADAPHQTSSYDGSTPASRVGAAVESALVGLAYGTSGRQELEQRVHGNPSQNAGVDYAARISNAERQTIDAVGGAGTTDRLLHLLAAAPRVTADATAREAAAALGSPTGDLNVPTLTMHTTADPLVVVQNETLFRRRVLAHGDGDRLEQLYIAPPAAYTSTPPYGAGHCAFTADQRVGIVSLLDGWVRTGERPTAQQESAAVGAGLQPPGFSPGGWPATS